MSESPAPPTSDAAKIALENLQQQLTDIQSSVSWKVTKPLRGASRVARKAKSVLTRANQSNQDIPIPDDLDLDFYRSRYPDMRELSDKEVIAHYTTWGRVEHRMGSGAPLIIPGRVPMDPEKETIAILLHEAAPTGAPILGWNLAREFAKKYNVLAIVIVDGELVEPLKDVCVAVVRGLQDETPELLEHDVQYLNSVYHPKFVIANSAHTDRLIAPFENAGVPVIALVHEFNSTYSRQNIDTVVNQASEIVFPAECVADSAKQRTVLAGRRYQVFPQGATQRPAIYEDREPLQTELGMDLIPLSIPEVPLDEFLQSLTPDDVVVMNAGQIQPRKGVEFFMQAAAHIRDTHPDAKIKFVWMGERYQFTPDYLDELFEQYSRDNLADRITFITPSREVDRLYERADIFYLTSRLDPFPNVALEAALAGIPVVTFAGSGGIAEWLLAKPEFAPLVVPYLASAQAGEVIYQLAANPEQRKQLGAELQDYAHQTFDLPRYIEHLDELGTTAATTRQAERLEAEAIKRSGKFDADFFNGFAADGSGDDDAAIAKYLRQSSAAAPLSRPRTGLIVQRPNPAFHPLAYAEQNSQYVEARDGDPFTHYLTNGEPEGPWVTPLITPESPVDGANQLSVLVHGHFHHPDLLDDMLRRLSLNSQQVDVVITTTSDENRQNIESLLSSAFHNSAPAQNGESRWSVEVTPNRGRNFGPLLTAIGPRLAYYDLVLHVHGKKSHHLQGGVGTRWSKYLYTNLIGTELADTADGDADADTAPPISMLDRIVTAFSSDPNLGLVFPTDRNLMDWNLNRPQAEQLAARLGLKAPLPHHFDFPDGGMFMARTAALQPLLDANLTWDDYPAEPVPSDGTMLHALERLIPFVTAEAGFTYAETYVPGVYR